MGAIAAGAREAIDLGLLDCFFGSGGKPLGRRAWPWASPKARLAWPPRAAE